MIHFLNLIIIIWRTILACSMKVATSKFGQVNPLYIYLYFSFLDCVLKCVHSYVVVRYKKSFPTSKILDLSLLDYHVGQNLVRLNWFQSMDSKLVECCHGCGVSLDGCGCSTPDHTHQQLLEQFCGAGEES